VSAPNAFKQLEAVGSVSIGVRGYGGVGVQVFGTFSGTVTFEATVDERNWVALNMVPSNSATPASTTTSAGAWTANCSGFASVRARISTYASGQFNISVQVSEAAGRF
jgi:hypothetical protein